MSNRKFTEANVPESLKVRVRYNKSCPGWLTQCQLIDRASGEVVCTAYATCSLKEQPVRKIGRAIAVGRALKEYYGGSRHEED